MTAKVRMAYMAWQPMQPNGRIVVLLLAAISSSYWAP